MVLKVAVIGAGAMGQNHLRVYSKMKNVKIAGVADAAFGNAHQAAQVYNCNAYASADELLANEKLDAVSIVVPTKLHFQIAAQVISAKIPLLVEKPITFNSQDARKLIALSKKNKTLLMPGHVERFNPVVIAAKTFLKTGRLGKPVSYLFRRIGLFPARVKDINVIQDIGVHDIDLLHFLSGSKPQLKCASAGSAFIAGRYDYAQMLFEVNGASAVLECNWITPTRVREFHIVGDQGVLKADLFNQKLEFYPTIVKRDSQNKVEQMFAAVKSEEIAVKKAEPLEMELEYFLKCVKSGENNLMPIEDAALAVEIANEATNSLMKRFAVKKALRIIGVPDSITNRIIKQD